MSPLLTVRDLRSYLATGQGVVRAVDGVSLTLGEAEILGIVGESGSGKSVTCRTIVGLMPPGISHVSGEVIYHPHGDASIVGARQSELPSLRGSQLAMIFQDPMTALNPVLTVGDQVIEAVQWAGATWGGDGVDVDTWGVLEYPGGRRLHLSCGLGRGYDTYTSLEGTAGRIVVSNPFHPGPGDSYQVIPPRGETVSHPATAGEASFTAAIRHINAVLAGAEEPRLLAVDTALRTAQALHDLAGSFTARRPTEERRDEP
jgi:ABC-type dipeptide/oligopeptide/nickel transport system ATPase component